MRRAAIVLAILVVIGLVGIIALTRTLRYGFSTHDEPTAMEAMIARAVRHWAVPADLRDQRNPVALTNEVLAGARAHWADHCASCHGNDGKGQTEMGQHLYPRAPDMTLAATQELSDAELFAIIENGIRLTGMPGWGDGTAASAKESWELVHFIRHLPRITRQELEQMRAMNPVSPAELLAKSEEEEFLAGDSETEEQPTVHSHH